MDKMELVTERLRIVPFTKQDISEDYVSWLNNQRLMQYSEQRHRTHSIDSCLQYLSTFDDSPNLFLSIYGRHDEQLYGTMTVYRDLSNRLADMGILIGAENIRGKGVGKEAWSAVVNWVLERYRPRKITAGCMANNLAMIQLMRYAEMEPDGIRKGHYLWNNQPVDLLYMARYLD